LYNATKALENGQTQTGTKKVVDAGNVATGVGSGAATGAAIGTAVGGWALGLGDAATKNVGVAAGSVAAGDHEHTKFIAVGGDPNTYYPVLLSNGVLRGVTISRYVHQDETWFGALRLHINGVGGSWGGDYPYLDYTLTQLWGSGFTTGCVADIAAASGSDGVFVWLRGGRTYSITGIGLATTVYLSGVTEPNGVQRMPMSSGPLYQLNNVASLDGVQLFRGAPGNNKPYWHGENLPISTGTFTPYLDDSALTVAAVSAEYMRQGGMWTFRIYMTIYGDGSKFGNRFALRGLPFNVGNGYIPVSAYGSMLTAGTPRPGAPITACATASEIQFFYTTANGNANGILQEHIRPTANGQIELMVSGTCRIQ
jgi:hypothetical protein